MFEQQYGATPPEGLVAVDALYLVEPVESGSDSYMLEHHLWEKLFTMQLQRWTEDAQDWPHPLSYALFCDWFEVQVIGVVFDSEPSFIRRERLL